MMKHIYLIIIFTTCYLLRVDAQCVGTTGQVTWKYWGEQPSFGFDYLYADPSFPNGPDISKTLFSVATPFNYGSNYGALTAGFIQVPESGPVTFNVTGDDHTVFYLSTDTSADNLIERAQVESWTGRDEYDKFPKQTSATINLVTDQYYYFELHHIEGEGGDHAALHWKTDFISQSEWTIITSQYLTDICDASCPPEGTSCDDGNPSTTDDIEDGNCNCVGIYESQNTCIGDRGQVQAYFFDDISGGELSLLYDDPDYPTMPDRLEVNTTGLFVDWDDNIVNYGSLIQGYLTVPRTGDYLFNITGNYEVKFLLSNDDSPNNISTTIETLGYTGPFDHNIAEFNGSQLSTSLSLQKGQYYYYEVHHKVPSWAPRFSVFWSTTHLGNDRWHRVPSMHLFDYTCELACLPTGQACNDGNSQTAMDQIEQCSCIGTPCGGNTGVPCDDAAADYVNYPYCETSYELDNRQDDGWLSCVVSDNPYIPARSGKHWIHYDLGDEYQVNEIHIWNYNVPGLTDRGFQLVIVDYSLDGLTWTNLNTFSWNQASGRQGYSGFRGPDLNGEPARYIMFTSLDPPSTCRGISKAVFNIEACPDRGTPCDDSVAQTVNDHYTSKCDCRGYLPDELDCIVDTLYINENEVAPQTYHAIKALISEDEILQSSDINYRAGMEIVLEAGFEVSGGSTFLAEIEDCGGAALVPVAQASKKKGKSLLQTISKRPVSLDVYTQKNSKIQTIHTYIPEATSVFLEIVDQESNVVASLTSHHMHNYGDKYKRVQTRKLRPGVYLVRMTTENTTLVQKMTVL